MTVLSVCYFAVLIYSYFSIFQAVLQVLLCRKFHISLQTAHLSKFHVPLQAAHLSFYLTGEATLCQAISY